MYNRCTLVEFRGVWIASVYNIDWPKTLDNPEAQKQEFIEEELKNALEALKEEESDLKEDLSEELTLDNYNDILDKLDSLNINAIFVQVRPTSDALYKSYINPWSKYLTGEQGKYPGYDPLQFMIEETHKRDMEFHAWLNPYRITTQGTDLNELAPNNPARIKPEWVLEFNNALFYDPENPEVIEYVAITVYEIIKKYDVDGIHFDDYFYPYDYPLPEGEDREGEVANNRREAVNNLIRTIYKVIKSTKPSVQFGVSPYGVWKNKSSDLIGSESNSLESYYDLYMDTLTWIDEHIVDYIAPQIYWSTDNNDINYEVMVSWWNDVVKDSGVRLYIGQNINDLDIASEIYKQIEINREYEYVSGNILFSASDIMNDNDNIVMQLKEAYNCKAILPTKFNDN